MQVSLMNSPSMMFGAKRVHGRLRSECSKTFKVSSVAKEEKYYKQYAQGVKNVCAGKQGDLSSATMDLNKLEHRFFYNTSGLKTKNVKSKKSM